MMDFSDLFACEHAANRQVLDTMRETPSLPDRAHSVASHVLAAQRVWLERMTGGTSQTPVWPNLSPDERDVWLAENHRAFQDHLASDPELDAPISYRTSRGDSFQNTPREILTHLLLHGAYHRGQLAASVREAGGTPPKTDLIVHLREPS